MGVAGAVRVRRGEINEGVSDSLALEKNTAADSRRTLIFASPHAHHPLTPGSPPRMPRMWLPIPDADVMF